MQTTESSEIGRLDLDSATALIMEPEEAPVSEEITEEEIEQPTEDPIDESEDYEETDESDASDNDDEEEEEAEADDESEEESDEDEYEDEEDEAEEEGPGKDFHTVTVDGEEIQVNLDELKRGYSGQKYVQKGMQQAAEAKKEAEGVYGALMQERQQLAQLLQQAQNGELSLTPPKEPSIEMLETAPFEYLSAKEKYEKDMRAYQEKMGQVQQQLQQQSVAEQRAQVVYAQQEAQKLVESLPELKDPKKADQFQRNLLSGAQKYFNYTPEQVGMIRNHQDFVTLHHAIKYAELMEGKPQAEKKVRKAKPAIKPGAKKTASKTKAQRDRMAKLRKSGNPLDALDLLIDPNLR